LVRAIGIFFHAAKAAPTAEDCRDLAAGSHHGISGGRLSPPGDMGPACLSQDILG
jgi:hypothetical protein